jgi:superfamily II DNA/RNA helicase
MENKMIINLKPFLQKAWEKQGFKEGTPIQQRTIPLVLEGNDLIAESPTGTGKTLAYLLPLLDKLNLELKSLQGVILAPTRELVMQIQGEIQKFTSGTEINSAALIGGADMKRQIEKLKSHPKLIVGTPGRILELIRLKKLKMHDVKTMVVDEADQMMDLGFMNEVKDVIKTTLRDRQLLFFSATIPERVEVVGKEVMNNPKIIRVTPKELPPSKVEHLYFISERRDKIDTLRRIVKMFDLKALTFIGDSKQFDEVVSKLQFKGVELGVLYGLSTKTERESVIQNFREGKFPLLIATDIAARGLDIQGLTHVIHFDLPELVDQYVHRSGRTGRMGGSGTVISIITANEEDKLLRFGKKLDIQMEKKNLYQGQVVEEKPNRARPKRSNLAQESKNNPKHEGSKPRRFEVKKGK